MTTAFVTIPAEEYARLQEEVAYLAVTNRDLNLQLNAAFRVAKRRGASDKELAAEIVNEPAPRQRIGS
jgi:hypothetical protein